MRWRVILGLSLVANLLLAIAWHRAANPPGPETAATESGTNIVNSTNVRTAVIVRRQFFTWQQLESQDYPTYIKNLREIGCPEQTVRDIIIADVTEMLRQKYQDAGPQSKPNPKWWTNHRETMDEDLAAQNSSRMWAERAAILEQLLGPDWAVRNRGAAATANTNTYQNRILATLEVNPVLQGLTADQKQQLATVLSQSPVLNLEADSAASPTGWDSAKVAAAEKARWSKLAEILTVEQLETAKLYFSIHAEDLRNEFDALPGFETKPEEFKRAFHDTEPIDEQLAELAGRDDAAARSARTNLLAQREAAIRRALTPPRYELYARLSDPAYLNALESLGSNKGDANSIPLLYAINREASAEQERIENDPTLTETQREIELKKLELEQLKATAQAMGEELLDEPGQKEAPAKPEPAKIHHVLAGENLERLSRIYGLPPAVIQAANPNLNFNQLPAGANVSIPLRLLYPLPPPPAQ